MRRAPQVHRQRTAKAVQINPAENRATGKSNDCVHRVTHWRCRAVIIGNVDVEPWPETGGRQFLAFRDRAVHPETVARFRLLALTAAVQSSSAVMAAAVGFVNAGLLSLTQAVWVVYGTNVGTTFTGWIVAATGFELKLDSYALPLLGVGIAFRLSGEGTKRAAYGEALSGFGLFLLGISVLKTSFSHLTANVDFSVLPADGWQAVAVYFMTGALLTAVIQSSSATTALALTAASAGLLPLPHAALIIVGADLGTSSTAVLASLGANSNARRVAASHVLFNTATAVFAVTTLPWLLPSLARAVEFLGFPNNPAVTLALFSTTFNFLGVILMLPVTAAMVRFLEHRFVTAADELTRLKYLDARALAEPSQSLHNLMLEVQNLGRSALQLAMYAALNPAENRVSLESRAAVVNVLGENIRSFIGRMNRSSLPAGVADALAPLLRAMQHYEDLAELVCGLSALEVPAEAELVGKRRRFLAMFVAALTASDTGAAEFDVEALKQLADATERAYEELKSDLLLAAAAGRMALPVMENEMEEIGRIHRIMQKAEKASQRLVSVRLGPLG